ncbi:hypothetical protein [Tenacibaculum sp. 190524A05c]|uniref:hypothetical protein n=1 Tax=Tenacibaculum platacis TaxID=3137852 RepID=UPI0032B20465
MRFYILVIVLLSSFKLFSQNEKYKDVIRNVIENYNYSKIDSLARIAGYAKGDSLKSVVVFKVNHKGKTFDVKATGSYVLFNELSEKIFNSMPKLYFDVKLKEGQHFMFEMPLVYRIR